MFYERVVRSGLFRLGGGDAETAHDATLRALATVSRLPPVLAALHRQWAVHAPVKLFGITFPNAVGLAAGLDKDGVALPAWPALGFGFVEVGTVTLHPQLGNDRPRLFRLSRSQALVNRMGFNNAGALALARRLATYRQQGGIGVPLGINLGKSRVTPLDQAVTDYSALLRLLAPFGDYVVINVSSPNTPGLRRLQDRTQLDELLAALVASRGGVAQASGPPLLVKIAPDLTDSAIADLLAVCLERGVAGVVATNTTLRREGLGPGDVVRAAQAGGLSGAPLAGRVRAVVAFVHSETAGRLPVVGVGGVMSADDAVRLVDAGAALVQLCTGLVYRGPALVRATATALAGRGTGPIGRTSGRTTGPE